MNSISKKQSVSFDINIYDYLDFRVFLADMTKELKQRGGFDLRSFAKKAGLKSPGFLKMVIDGKRHVVESTARGFCEALNVIGREQEYFVLLVMYAQEQDPDVKFDLFEKIMSLRPRSLSYQMQKRQSRYFSRPYYVCIREMVALHDFREDPQWIAKRCFPKIRPSQAEEAIKTLLELGLLRRDENGKLLQTEDFIQTQDSIKAGIEAYHYHESVLDKARHALGLLPQDERNYYALTLPLPKSLYNEFIQDFYDFRDRMVQKLNCLSKEVSLEEVFQINFQFFPLTRRREDAE